MYVNKTRISQLASKILTDTMDFLKLDFQTNILRYGVKNGTTSLGPSPDTPLGCSTTWPRSLRPCVEFVV